MSDGPRPADPLESLLVRCFERPRNEWSAAIDDLCCKFPDRRGDIRRHFARLQRMGIEDVERVAERPPPDPERVGPYRILGRLGHGGMGVVYRSEQLEPLQRHVALKLIKPGLDSEAVVSRFATERQALARMTSPYIAKVLDAGASEEGRPWFVMELVEGETITTFCDRRTLKIRARLELFRAVCEGVQHAHQKGVIHRDLKPSNVLVAEQDGGPLPKIIDFGIAKAIGGGLGDRTQTQPGWLVGTPEYMSPEQAGPGPHDVDTRSDVYSLGVLLYELLAGCRPYEAAIAPETWRRTVEPSEVPRPSTRFATHPDAAQIAARRGMDVRSLRRALQGDLDWVLLRALAVEPDSRYETPAALARELQRYLRHEPVLAGRGGAGYRLKKLLRRYRAQATAAAAVGAALVACTVVSAVAFARASANESLANESSRIANDRAHEVALQRSRLEAQKATIEQTAASLQRRTSEFETLANGMHLRVGLRREATLHPPWPEQLAELEHWLAHDAARLREALPSLHATVEDLKRRALPRSEGELEAERRAHAEFPVLERLQAKLAAQRRARSVCLGETKLVVPELPRALVGEDAKALDAYAWQRTTESDEERLSWGEEAQGLAAAQAAVARVRDGDTSIEQPDVLVTLARAWLAVGRREEAVEAARQAVTAAPEDMRPRYRETWRDVKAAATQLDQDEQARRIAELDAQVIALVARIRNDRRYAFAEPADQYLFDKLRELTHDIGLFLAQRVPQVEQRRDWARRIEQLTREHPHARTTWETARAAILKADGKVASELYRAQPIDLAPQVGLVPIGMNPATKLWEFYELRSAWDGKRDPAELEIPIHDEHGLIAVDEGTGIVLVLLPGGTFTMGAQKENPAVANYDPGAKNDESPCVVTLTPFFLARHELTQGQWSRLAEWDMERMPSNYRPDVPISDRYARGLFHPVECVDATMCDKLLTRYGMTLPTEAQWEYGCRAGTSTPWWTGADKLSLVGAANLSDRTARAEKSEWGPTLDWLEDGFVVHAPVDTLRPNPWGLHHMHGNVYEWTRDYHVEYRLPARPGDGLRPIVPEIWSLRVARGGGFEGLEASARSANRNFHKPGLRHQTLGVRAAREVRPR